MEFKPRGLQNSMGVCYSNAVLQCLANLAKSIHSLIQLQRLHAWQSHTNRFVYSPFTDLLVVLREMTKSSLHGPFDPHRFQLTLANKGKENGVKFASGEGAYPFEWLCFLLGSIYETPKQIDHTKALQFTLARLLRINSAYKFCCSRCGREQVEQNLAGITEWGLKLDPKGHPGPMQESDLTVSIQQLLQEFIKQTQTVYRDCCEGPQKTHVECSWQGLINPPEFLVFDIKTYEKITVREGQEQEYKFLFSRIKLDDMVWVTTSNATVKESYVLQAVVKLEGEGHEHAVAYVRSKSHCWWRCDDEEVESCDRDVIHDTIGYNQISLCFYRKAKCEDK